MFFRYAVDPDVQDWIWDNFTWAIQQGLLTPETLLMTMTAQFFTAPKGRDERTAQALLDDVARHLNIGAGVLTALPLNRLKPEHQIDYNSLSATGGTWQDGGDQGIVHYDPNLFDQPQALISVLIHEAMHHVLHSIPEYPPGGPKAEELATDLHCITMGCGALQLAGAEQIGWQGYMRQPTRAHALAVFAAVQGLDAKEVQAHLPPRATKLFRRAVKEVAKSATKIADLRGLIATKQIQQSGWSQPRPQRSNGSGKTGSNGTA